MNLIPLPLPWLELSIVVALVGALCVSPLRNPVRAWRLGLVFSGAAFACTLLACLGFYLAPTIDADTRTQWSIQETLFGGHFLSVDELNAPLLPMVGLLHFLTALATGRTKMRRFSLSWSLAAEAVRLATFGATAPWALVALEVLGTVPAYLELVNRGRPTQVYVLHMGLFIGLLVLGWAFVDPTRGHAEQTGWATVPLLLALL